MPINQYQSNNDPININNSRLSYNLSNQTPLESFVQSIYVQNVNSLDKNNSQHYNANQNQPNHLNISMLSKNNNHHINHLNNIKEDVSEERRQQLKAHLEKVERLQRMGKGNSNGGNNNNNSVSINNRNINYL